jgi:hypothetical protein
MFRIWMDDEVGQMRAEGRGAVLVANLTRPDIDWVSVRVVGIRLDLQFSKVNDKHGNTN